MGPFRVLVVRVDIGAQYILGGYRCTTFIYIIQRPYIRIVAIITVYLSYLAAKMAKQGELGGGGGGVGGELKRWYSAQM